MDPWEKMGPWTFLIPVVIWAVLMLIGYRMLYSSSHRVVSDPKGKENFFARVYKVLQEAISPMLTWLKRGWSTIALLAIIAATIFGWKFIVHHWYYFLLADIVINVILMHFVVMPLQEIKNELEGFEFLWLAVLAILLWMVLLAEELIGFFLGDEDDVEVWD